MSQQPAIDTNFAADQIVANLRAMECDEALAREILALCHMRITRGDLRRSSQTEGETHV